LQTETKRSFEPGLFLNYLPVFFYKIAGTTYKDASEGWENSTKFQ
jgi:hypothetical protein